MSEGNSRLSRVAVRDGLLCDKSCPLALAPSLPLCYNTHSALAPILIRNGRPMTFDELGLMPQLLANVKRSGYETPTPIQRETIPLVLAIFGL